MGPASGGETNTTPTASHNAANWPVDSMVSCLVNAMGSSRGQ